MENWAIPFGLVKSMQLQRNLKTACFLVFYLLYFFHNENQVQSVFQRKTNKKLENCLVFFACSGPFVEFLMFLAKYYFGKRVASRAALIVKPVS